MSSKILIPMLSIVALGIVVFNNGIQAALFIKQSTIYIYLLVMSIFGSAVYTIAKTAQENRLLINRID